eukprot:m.102857 g.102857  ORF g.102857 m.102857 type:complete len:562 (-) comp27444_c0_seq1:337-2022(-)
MVKSSLAVLVCFAVLHPTTSQPLPSAHWMSGGFGIGMRIAADYKPTLSTYNVTTLVNHVRSISDRVRWVLINLSDAAHGDAYLAPHSILSKITPGSTPNDDRDLFGEILDEFNSVGIKVITYAATQGPAMLKHGECKSYDSVSHSDGTCTSQAMENWAEWVNTTYGNVTLDTLKYAYANNIIKEFADRYGSKIGGWWFDHADFGNIPLLHKIITDANPDITVAFNRGLKVPLINNNPGFEDFTSGHPNPVQRTPANNSANLGMLTSIEQANHGLLNDGAGRLSLGHMFMPLQTVWNSGDIVWPIEQAAEWQDRAMCAHGAWTWNIATNDAMSSLAATPVEFLKSLQERIANVSMCPPTVGPTSSPTAAPSLSPSTSPSSSPPSPIPTSQPSSSPTTIPSVSPSSLSPTTPLGISTTTTPTQIFQSTLSPTSAPITTSPTVSSPPTATPLSTLSKQATSITTSSSSLSLAPTIGFFSVDTSTNTGSPISVGGAIGIGFVIMIMIGVVIGITIYFCKVNHKEHENFEKQPVDFVTKFNPAFANQYDGSVDDLGTVLENSTVSI